MKFYFNENQTNQNQAAEKREEAKVNGSKRTIELMLSVSLLCVNDHSKPKKGGDYSLKPLQNWNVYRTLWLLSSFFLPLEQSFVVTPVFTIFMVCRYHIELLFSFASCLKIISSSYKVTGREIIKILNTIWLMSERVAKQNRLTSTRNQCNGAWTQVGDKWTGNPL